MVVNACFIMESTAAFCVWFATYPYFPSNLEARSLFGLRNDGFQYAFISLGNKIGMAIGTALLAGLLGKYGYVANQTQNAAVLSIMKHAFTTIPGVLWIVTAVVLFFYRLNKKRYNEIVEELKNGKRG